MARQKKMSICVLFGAMGGSVLGLLDALLGTRLPGPPLEGGALGMLFLIGTVLLVPLGACLGMASCLVAAPVAGRVSLRSGIRWFRARPWATAAAFVVAAILSLLTIWFGYRRGIQLDAVDYRPLLLGLVGMALLISGTVVAGAGVKRSSWIAVSVVTFSVGTSLTCLPVLGEHVGLIPLLQARTICLGPVIRTVRRAYDADRDGYPSAICGEDCDCDDMNPARNPGALDIPDNGIDEDCSGGDLVARNLRSRKSEPGRSAVEGEPLLSPPYNIVLITIDALRADRMHMYGHHRETTPNLDAFAREGVRFEQVRTQGPSTRFAFPVILTGRYFSGIALEKGEKWYRLLPSNVTFAERLKAVGYRTAALLPYFRFKEHSGFQQGFDVWEPTLKGERNPTWEPTGDLVTDRGIEHLDDLRKKEGPWLLWLHYFDPHAGYVKHDNQPVYGTEKADLYDGEVLYVDTQVQGFLDALKSRGLADEVAVIIASDHGEGIGLDTDHGFSYHGFSLYDSETRVPLMIRVPGVPPRRVSECVGIVDLVPTLLELGGVRTPADLHGASLLPYLLGANPDRGPILMERPGKSPEAAVVDWPYKLIWRIRFNRFFLFNLENDPNEQRDLAGEKPETVSRLAESLRLLRYEASR